jgi:integrase
MFNAAGNYFTSLASWTHPKMHYEKQQRRERVISRDEEARLLAELRAPRRPGKARTAEHRQRPGEQVLAYRTRLCVADLWELAPLVGMRRSEMRRLEKGWIDFSEELITLPKHIVKTRRSRVVPLSSDALDILRRRCAEFPDSKFVFTNARGTNAISEYQMYRAIRKAAALAKLDYGRDIEGGFVLHDNRHTAVTRMLHAGNDLATVGDIVGHSKETMTLTYGHSTLESRRRAVASLAKKPKRVDENLTGRDEEKVKAKAAE